MALDSDPLLFPVSLQCLLGISTHLVYREDSGRSPSSAELLLKDSRYVRPATATWVLTTYISLVVLVHMQSSQIPEKVDVVGVSASVWASGRVVQPDKHPL